MPSGGPRPLRSSSSAWERGVSMTITSISGSRGPRGLGAPEEGVDPAADPSQDTFRCRASAATIASRSPAST